MGHGFDTACVYLRIWLNFFLFITVLFCALLSSPVICYRMRYYYSSTGMGAGGNGNNQREWGGNGNKARLNMGLGMGMNRREWEGIGLKKTFPFISSAVQ